MSLMIEFKLGATVVHEQALKGYRRPAKTGDFSSGTT